MADQPGDQRRQPRGLRATDASADNDPVDLSALQADDALLDALGSGDPRVTGPMSEHQLNALLLAWRREVDAEPPVQLVDTETAVRIVTGTEAQRPVVRHRFLVPLTSAAAVIFLALLVVGFAARSAGPGDPLWGVTQVLYSEHAKSVQAAHTARGDLDYARRLLRDGDVNGARQVLDRMGQSIDAVQGEDGKDALLAARAQLLGQLQHPGAPSTGPTAGKPPSSFTARPVPPTGGSTSRGDGSSTAPTHRPPPDTSAPDTTTPVTTPPSTPPSTGSSGSGTPPNSAPAGSHTPTSGDDTAQTTSPVPPPVS